MVNFFCTLFNIRKDEWMSVLFLFTIAALVTTGSIWGSTIAYAAFLKQVGLHLLPWILVLSAILSFFATGIYTAFVDRINHQKLLTGIYIFGAASIALGLTLLYLKFSSIAFPILYLLFLARVAISNPHFITYVNSFYDIQSAKRVLPVITAGFRIGNILGGLTTPLLLAWFASDRIITIWLLTYIPIVGLVWLMPYFLRKKGASGKPPHRSTSLVKTASRRPYFLDLENIKEGFSYTIRSNYLRWIAIGTLLSMILLALIEYKTMELLLQVCGTQEELASFLALVTGIANIFALPILVFAISRLITLLGLNNVILFFPLINLFICGGLIFAPGTLSAIGAYLGYSVFPGIFQFPIDGLLYNAVPSRIKGRACAFVNGLVEPIGTLMGSLLLFIPVLVTSWWMIPLIIGILALAYVANTLVIRKQYRIALIKMLEEEDFSFMLPQESSDITTTDPIILAQLEKKLKESTSRELTVFMAQLISQTGSHEAGKILRRAIDNATDARMRSAILDVMAASNLKGDIVRDTYTTFLADPDEQVRQSAFIGLEQLMGINNKQFVALAVNMLNDSSTQVRIRVLSALSQTRDFYLMPSAMNVLNAFLADDAPSLRAQGVQILGQIEEEGALVRLAEYVNDPADEVRLEAATAIEARIHSINGHPSGTLFVAKMETLLHDPVERVRQAALQVIGHGCKQNRDLYPKLIEALSDSSPHIRATAVNNLTHLGKSVISVLHPKLNSPQLDLRKMVAVVLCRIQPEEFGPLVNTSIQGNLLNIYQQYAISDMLGSYQSSFGLMILQKVLNDRNQQLLDEIFYLMSAMHDADAVQLVNESLHSKELSLRASAMEVLETMTNPKTARLMSPFFDPEHQAEQILSIGKDVWDLPQPDMAKTLRTFLATPEEPWLRTIATFVLGELGASLTPSPRPPQPAILPDKPRVTFKLLDETNSENREINNGEGASEHIGSRRRTARRAVKPDLLSLLSDEASPETAQTSALPAVAPETKESDAIDRPSDSAPTIFTLPEIETLLASSLADSDEEVRFTAQIAQRMIAGLRKKDLLQKEHVMLSAIEKVIFLKQVSFFQGMTIEQLKVLANVCEEEFFPTDTHLFHQGESGVNLYVIVNGRVGIEQEKRKGSFVRVNTLEAYSYLGEVSVFDASPHTADAIAIQDTLTLRISREHLLALARQHPELSLQLINALNKQLRHAYDRIAELTRSRPRELHKLFDQFD
ncbi:transcriptional regulator, Crp/Fnr family [Candidatus Vecturithrix granuli]|uniref:Transcriptional regulator, Crp/Fnr family n=1 Tax=Vecturithrix granuli TaxID=1499967 RepID=A0A0S6W9F8_VECG1|nr:transcriptional regulator, Crp/Fnr family [Candidatus Vecturithrix granuli]